MLTNYLEYSINFSGAQQRPAINNFVSFAFRRTTTGPQKIGIAIKDALAEGKPFFGWLKKGKNKDKLARKLEIEDKFRAVIFSTEPFYWEKKKRTCFQGRVVIVQIFA